MWCSNWGIATGRISSICARPGKIYTPASVRQYCLCISSLIPTSNLGLGMRPYFSPRPNTLYTSCPPLWSKQADGITRQNVLKLSHPGKRPYFFQLPNSYNFERCVHGLVTILLSVVWSQELKFCHLFRWYGVLSEILRWQLTSTDSTPVNSWKLENPLDCCYESNYSTDKTGNENSHLYTTIEQVTNLRKNT